MMSEPLIHSSRNTPVREYFESPDAQEIQQLEPQETVKDVFLSPSPKKSNKKYQSPYCGRSLNSAYKKLRSANQTSPPKKSRPQLPIEAALLANAREQQPFHPDFEQKCLAIEHQISQLLKRVEKPSPADILL
jgi:hypothetical protein